MEADTAELAAPSTIQPEFWNALWQQHRRSELALEEMWNVWGEFTEAPVSFFEIDPLIPRAVEITAETGAIVYDALFVTLAETLDAIVVTADGKLLKTLKGTTFARRTQHLGGVSSLL